MKHPTNAHHRHLICLLAGLLLFAGTPARSEIRIGDPLRVAILWDNSGSMFPGYTPPGSPNRKSQNDLGVDFYHLDSQIHTWLADFVAAQTILDAKTITMSTFTSHGAFGGDDLTLVHPETPIAKLDIARAFAVFPAEPGSHTYIAESLERYSHGFEGLIWLITDNIVEKSVNQPDEDVRRFFEMLRDGERYRAVHLFKYHFVDDKTKQAGNLAVYGILVSDTSIKDPVLKYYDELFRGPFLDANRRGGTQKLFPERAYWKLKKIDIGALELELSSALEVQIQDVTPGFFRESQTIKLSISGSFESKLTQHRIISGSYSLRAHRPFDPKVETADATSRSFGIEPADPSAFVSELLPLPLPIESGARKPFLSSLTSRRPIDLNPQGFRANWILAFKPMHVRYDGHVKAVFQDIEAEFDSSRMEGIFGAQAAPEIFQANVPIRFSADESKPRSVSFVLETSYYRQALGALFLVAVVALVTLVVFFWKQKMQFRLKIGDRTPTIVGLRRGVGSQDVTHESYRLGRLAATLRGEGRFTAERTSAMVNVQPTTTRGGSWNVTIRDQETFLLVIESLSGKPVLDASKDEPAGRSGGPPSPRRFSETSEPQPRQTPPPAGAPTARRPTIKRPGA